MMMAFRKLTIFYKFFLKKFIISGEIRWCLVWLISFSFFYLEVSLFDSFIPSYSHVKSGNYNVVAHKLAKLSSSYEEMMVWTEEVPPQIQEFVNYDDLALNQ